MDRLKGAARRQNDSIEHHLLTSGTGDAYQAIAASGARKVMFQLNCGTLLMDKWIPLSLVSGGVTIEMELSSDVDQGFWEPASSRIQFTLHNKDASNPLVPIAGPLAMFSRIRVFVSGIQVEN